MGKTTKTFIPLVAIATLCAVLLAACSDIPSVPNDYTETVNTGGQIEAKYLKMGNHDVSYFESAALMSFEKYEIYYPSDIESFISPLPVVIFVNGTGTTGSKYPALQKHMASWGFITIATEEKHAWNGFSAEMSVRYLELLNNYEGDGEQKIFRGKIDTECIGITGHSQGGFGVVNAITIEGRSENYKAAVILSSNAQTNVELQWEADATQIQTPTLIFGSTGAWDQVLASLDSLNELFEQIPNEVDKVLAMRNDADHGQMLYYGDGYVTAWFMYYLQGDEEAGKAFFGDAAEILNNEKWQDVKVNH